MSSEHDWMETRNRWDFAAPSADADTTSTTDFDLGYEAALPGLQALYADACEARARDRQLDKR